MSVRQARTVDIASIGKTCGFDWLFIDMEHGSHDIDMGMRFVLAGSDLGFILATGRARTQERRKANLA